MKEDPRLAIVQVMARLSKETQLHLDERHRHFRITNAVITSVSLLLIMMAVFNIYYVRVLYKDMGGIVTTMDLMYDNLTTVDENMVYISRSVEHFDNYLQHMQPINDNMTTMAGTLPSVRINMDIIKQYMGLIEHDMGLLSNSMGNIDHRVRHMMTSLPVMRENMHQMARPMGIMNPMLP